MKPADPQTFTFLFRTDQGRIDRRTWWRGIVALAAPLALATLGWLALTPWAHRGLGERDLFDLRSLAAYVYLLVYAFAILFIAVSFYNLSAKRWRDRGSPAALAGIVPLLILIAGAAHWLAPRSEDTLPMWIAYVLDGVALVAALWTVVELGCFAARPEQGI